MKAHRSLITALLVVAPIAAMAHVDLVSSTPVKGSTVKSSPEKVLLIFGEVVELKAMTIQKAGDKAETPLGPLPMASEQLVVPMPKLADGEYVIKYRFVGGDLHEMTATIPFKVSAAARPAVAAPAKK